MYNTSSGWLTLLSEWILRSRPSSSFLAAGLRFPFALASKLATNQQIYHLQSRDANAFRRTESASKPKQSSSLAFGQELWLLQDQTANTCKRYRHQKISISNRPQDHVTKKLWLVGVAGLWMCIHVSRGIVLWGNDLFPLHCFDTLWL